MGQGWSRPRTLGAAGRPEEVPRATCVPTGVVGQRAPAHSAWPPGHPATCWLLGSPREGTEGPDAALAPAESRLLPGPCEPSLHPGRVLWPLSQSPRPPDPLGPPGLPVQGDAVAGSGAGTLLVPTGPSGRGGATSSASGPQVLAGCLDCKRPVGPGRRRGQGVPGPWRPQGGAEAGRPGLSQQPPRPFLPGSAAAPAAAQLFRGGRRMGEAEASRRGPEQGAWTDPIASTDLRQAPRRDAHLRRRLTRGDVHLFSVSLPRPPRPAPLERGRRDPIRGGLGSHMTLPLTRWAASGKSRSLSEPQFSPGADGGLGQHQPPGSTWRRRMNGDE